MSEGDISETESITYENGQAYVNGQPIDYNPILSQKPHNSRYHSVYYSEDNFNSPSTPKKKKTNMDDFRKDKNLFLQDVSSSNNKAGGNQNNNY